MRHTGSVSDTRIVCVPAILSVLSLTKEIWIFPILEILVFGRLFHWSNYQKTCQQNRKTHGERLCEQAEGSIFGWTVGHRNRLVPAGDPTVASTQHNVVTRRNNAGRKPKNGLISTPK